MTEMHRALNVGVEENLLPLSALLQQRGVLHRVYEEGGRQVVAVARADQVELVQSLYRAWRNGELGLDIVPGDRRRHRPPPVMHWQAMPVTLALLALSFCGFLLIYLHAPLQWVGQFTFLPIEPSGDRIVFGDMGGEYWRLVTPVFLHFGWLHIVFNSLWLWDLGGRVERVLGQFNMLMLFIVIAVVSNVSQFNYDGNSLFGGMSGVVYGLLGFSWIAPLLQPQWRIQPVPGIMLFMIGWLLFCMSGVVEVLGFGAIANAAHVGGLFCGLALGVIFGAFSRFTGDRP